MFGHGKGLEAVAATRSHRTRAIRQNSVPLSIFECGSAAAIERISSQTRPSHHLSGSASVVLPFPGFARPFCPAGCNCFPDRAAGSTAGFCVCDDHYHRLPLSAAIWSELSGNRTSVRDMMLQFTTSQSRPTGAHSFTVISNAQFPLSARFDWETPICLGIVRCAGTDFVPTRPEAFFLLREEWKMR
jgi:hypothetical protein